MPVSAEYSRHTDINYGFESQMGYLPLSETDLQYANGAGPSKVIEEVFGIAPSPQPNNHDTNSDTISLATIPGCFELNPAACEDLSEKVKGKQSANPVRFKSRSKTSPNDVVEDSETEADTASDHPSDASTAIATEVESDGLDDNDDNWLKPNLRTLPKSKFRPMPMKKREPTKDEKKNLIIRWAEKVLKINLDGTTEPGEYATKASKYTKRKTRHDDGKKAKIVSKEKRYGTAEQQARGLEGVPTLDADAMTQEEFDRMKVQNEKEEKRVAARNRLMGRGVDRNRRAWDEAGRALHLRMQEVRSLTEEEFNALNEECRRAPPPQRERFGLRREQTLAEGICGGFSQQLKSTPALKDSKLLSRESTMTIEDDSNSRIVTQVEQSFSSESSQLKCVFCPNIPY